MSLVVCVKIRLTIDVGGGRSEGAAAIPSWDVIRHTAKIIF